MEDLIQPNSWVALKLPSGTVRILQVAPNTTISLGKYGSFPSNLIISRPYHITWELLDKRQGENFCRLRIVPAAELYADLYSEAASDVTTPAPEADLEQDSEVAAAAVDPESTILNADKEIKAAAAAVESSARAANTNISNEDDTDIDVADPLRQTLSMREIEVLKKDGARAGKDLINKLINSHTAIDQKTVFSLAKYRLLKTKKYIRRFSVMPFDVARMGNWLLEDKDPLKILEMREEMIALVGCWGNVHYGGDVPHGFRPAVLDPETGRAKVEAEEENAKMDGDDTVVDGSEENVNIDEMAEDNGDEDDAQEQSQEKEPLTGRWIIVDDTGGLLTAAMAERMGILYENKDMNDPFQLLNAFGQQYRNCHGGESRTNKTPAAPGTKEGDKAAPRIQNAETKKDGEVDADGAGGADAKMDVDTNPTGTTNTATEPTATSSPKPTQQPPRPKRIHRSDFEVPLAPTNTLTILHQNGQPNLSFLKYWDFDITNPNPHKSTHPLSSHLLSLTWLQLVEPRADTTYVTPPPEEDDRTLASWKASRRGNYHRKRRRWARTRWTVDSTREGGHSGLVCASVMDPVSIMRNTLPLLAGGAPVAIYSPSIEPLMELADSFSLGRRSAWAARPPEGARGLGRRELERWTSKEFPLNPSLLLGVTVNECRARRWQTHPGRTHPLMTSRGGAEGWVLTGYRAVPAEGRVEARGKFKRRKVGN